CQTVFGIGSRCLPSGLCGTEPLDPRCMLRLPTGASGDPSRLAGTVPVATIVNGSLDGQEARALSVELALSDASEVGVGGRGFSLLVCTNEPDFEGDGRDRGDATAMLGTYLEALGVVAIVGPPSSSDVQRIAAATGSALLISPSATSNALTGLDPLPASDATPGRFWRTAAPDTQQGIRIAEDVIARDVRTLALVHADDAYGQGLRDTVRSVLAERGATLAVSEHDFVEGDDASFGNAVAAAAGTTPAEVLFISSDVDVVSAFVTSAATLPGFETASFFLTDSAGNEDFATSIQQNDAARTTCGRIRGTRPEVATGAVTNSFRSRYQLVFGDDPTVFGFAANSYDAGWLVAIATGWAVAQEGAVLSADNLARGLRRISDGPAPVNLDRAGFADILDAFSRGESVDVSGASGSLDYDPETEETAAPTELWVIDDDCRFAVSP
ncbi:MAG: ABC transporter substrate-binding protein, partial [Myxococcota bacterium]